VNTTLTHRHTRMPRQLHDCKRIRAGFAYSGQHRVAARVQDKLFWKRVVPVLSGPRPANSNSRSCQESVSVTVSVEVPVGLKIRTADGTSINHIEGSNSGTAKDVVGPSFERDRARSSCVLAQSPGDRQDRVFREFAASETAAASLIRPLFWIGNGRPVSRRSLDRDQ
jgi:hypothetical protein